MPYQYTVNLHHKHIYSLGDVHGRGQEMLDFLRSLELSPQTLPKDACVIQLGDLIDCFAFPPRASIVNLRTTITHILQSPQLQSLDHHLPMLAPADSQDQSRTIAQLLDPACNIERDELFNELKHLYSALLSFQTLTLFSQLQSSHPDQFFILIGNHDVDLLRGKCRYAKRQKEFLLSFLGLTNSVVIAHMLEGCPFIIEQSPILKWLQERPHIALSSDTIYMHGGPTTSLSQSLCEHGNGAFDDFLRCADEARTQDWKNPLFLEHHSFLSPDGAHNDWHHNPETITSFCKSAQRSFIALAHSPFLHFPKGQDLDLDDPKLQTFFEKADRIGPGKMLIKHDTNLKRGGRFCACHHSQNTDSWEFLT